MALMGPEIVVDSPPEASDRQVGVRELKARTSEIIRYIREQQVPVEVTYRGQVVAKIVPVKGALQIEEDRRMREERWRRLSDEASRLWPSDVSAVDAVRDMRDDGCS